MSYDRLDWHIESAVQAGQPPENAFTHIGLYLAWLIRHDLHDPEMFPASHLVAVKAGEMTGSDLADDIDGKLVGDVMTDEGAAFSDACYAAYTDAYGTAFADEPDYSIADDDAARSRIDPVLDDLWAAWVTNGRRPAADAPIQAQPSRVLRREDLDRLQASIDRISEELRPPNPVSLEPHESPELEALIPAELTDPPMRRMSVSAARWGSSALRRSLKRLDVRPAESVVVYGMGGRGKETLSVIFFRVPAIRRDELLAEFRSVIFLPRGTWRTRVVAGRTVEWMTVPEFSTAFWASDGQVVQVSGRADIVEAAIPLLP